ncbi:phosphatidate cytidylyltransferase [Gudongella oleilytica]|uniref:phosphatidate cytidylyltransferase n=1 Tax=Gudongella oleilytica TaxID=1582259 RepID=UPI0019D04165|nr:phosphatidate cytidylyltransferase [Gudongella oleilytica]MDY0257003.1 phosphatidate cytidylyltransferase [Gudongella oleilytica]
MKDLGIRVASGAIGLVLLLSVLFAGGPVLGIGLLIVSTIALKEFYTALKKLGRKPLDLIGYVAAVLLLASFYYQLELADLIVSALTLLLLSTTVLSKRHDILDAAITLTGVIYIPFLLYHILLMDGKPIMLVVFLIAFGTDTFAYIIGSKFGKKRLCPEISPKKSVEGAIGGIVGSILVTMSYGAFYEIGPLWSIGILSLIGSVLSQLGDLTASRIKRITGVKDFGSIMPGHGGMLDRFDSVIFTAPLVFYYMQYFLR